MSDVKSVSRHEEASAVGGSFGRQGGLIERQSVPIRVRKTTCCAISTNLASINTVSL